LGAKNINKAIQVICGEMEKLATKEVTAQELVDAKTHIRGGLTLSLEDSSEQADWYAREALFEAEIHTPEDRLQAIEAVTAADVKRVAKKLFVSGEMRVAIIGDVKKDTIEF
jgi:zinc protease